MSGKGRPGGAAHALVVGGSGMLAGLCRLLSADGWEVTVVGRDRDKLARAAHDDARIHPLSVDYQQTDGFFAALEEATATRGPIVLAVCWIRSWLPRSLLTAAAAVAPGGRLFHVVGSERSAASAAAIAELQRRDELSYHQVELGAVVDSSGRRWLSDDEISGGVYTAVKADRPYFLVGTLAP
jgi:NAD(P)-dependent dehydrogenase (short-subunit alcohol dehydrogenase family)